MKKIRFTAYQEPKPGDRFGRLTVIETLKIGKYLHLKCRCDCGVEVTPSKDNVKRGTTASCGCLRNELRATINLKHGDTNSPEYASWAQMIQRCTNPKNKLYYRYGGRGIRVCDEWRSSYEAFLTHIGRKPSKKHTIERIENNGNYEPGNVKWATRTEQNNNRSDNRFIEFNGKRQTMAEWARETGLSYDNIKYRLNAGWSPEMALKTKTV